MKAFCSYALAALFFFCSHSLVAQNFNYLNNDGEFDVEISSQLDNEQGIIFNLVILMDYDLYNRNYRAMLRGLDRLASVYSPDSLSLLMRELELFENHHPFLQLCENKRSGIAAYSGWAPYKSKQFEDYFSEQVELLKKYERLAQESNLPAGKIYKNSTYYLTNHAYAEAMYLLKWLKEEYPNTYYVKRNFVENRLRNIKLGVGKKLPIDNFTATDGTIIQMVQANNDPTLIAYLDVFSNDYKAELSNMLQVGEKIKDIRLIILLNSDILQQELRTHAQSAAPALEWVIANEALKSELGLSDYSSNLLVSAQNRIIAKDMSFDKLPEEVAFFCNKNSILAKK